MSYDDNNIFSRILRGEVPATKIYEDEHVLAIQDIHPQAPTHILVMPKGKYVSFDDFSAKASDAEIVALTKATGLIAREAGVADTGYRLIVNCNAEVVAVNDKRFDKAAWSRTKLPL